MNRIKHLADKIVILYRDKHCLVAYKPPGILSQGDSTGDPDLVQLIRKKSAADQKKNTFSTVVHRLDRPVAGLVLIARSQRMAAELSQLLRDHLIRKQYLAVVHGSPPPSGILTDRLVKDTARNRVSIATEKDPGAVTAELEYRRIETRAGRSLVEIELHTGRSHQIRVQFASRSHPVVADRKYGSREVLKNPGMIALWAYKLSFTHPLTGRSLAFESPKPAHWPWYQQPKRSAKPHPDPKPWRSRKKRNR